MYVGVDGCRLGWCAVALGAEGDAQVEVFPSFAALWDAWGAAHIILVDIPIGLMDGSPQERLCDVEARRALGQPRGSSVFPAPSRRALGAETYQEASALNRDSTGRGLSRQSWAIMPKIREVDRLLEGEAGARSLIREVHPEVLFWALSGGRPLLTPKKTPSGFLERLQVLEAVHPGSTDLIDSALRRWKRSEVARDDLVDAMAAAVTARLGRDRFQTLPGVPEVDGRGLPMEMIFASPDPPRLPQLHGEGRRGERSPGASWVRRSSRPRVPGSPSRRAVDTETGGWYIDPSARQIAEGGAFFYPCSDSDWALPVAMFGELVADLWLVDIKYFTRRRLMTHEAPLLEGVANWELFRIDFEGPPTARGEFRMDETGSRYRHLEPGTRTEHYRRIGTGYELAIHRRRGYGQNSIRKVHDLSVFFHRADSAGEGGSGVRWLSNRWRKLLFDRLTNPGLIVTDGSLANPRVLKELALMDEDPEKVAGLARSFTKWGRRWECVGWAPARRTSPTLVWKVEAL